MTNFDEMLARAAGLIELPAQPKPVEEVKCLRLLSQHATTAFRIRIYDWPHTDYDQKLYANDRYYLLAVRDYTGSHPIVPRGIPYDANAWLEERIKAFADIGIQYMDSQLNGLIDEFDFSVACLSPELHSCLAKSPGANNAGGVVDFCIRKDSAMGRAFHPATGLFF